MKHKENYLDYFIGQSKIKEELKYLISSIKTGNNYNLLFRAPSGYGKTFLITLLLMNFPEEKRIFYPISDKITFLKDKRFHFIDEAHLIENPEIFYQYMDSGMYTIIFASNLSGFLPEALVNRCIQFIFQEYTRKDMARIIKTNIPYLNNRAISFLSGKVKKNPRVAKMITVRLNYFLKGEDIPKEKLKKILNKNLGIFEKGLTQLDKKYLAFLQDVGRASLKTISNSLGYDEALIKNEIEPFLLKEKMISISSRGRELREEKKE